MSGQIVVRMWIHFVVCGFGVYIGTGQRLHTELNQGSFKGEP